MHIPVSFDVFVDPSLPDHCEPTGPFLAFLSSHLDTCIPTPLALLSTVLGFLSIISWLFAQLPQIVKNYTLQSTSGLSIVFLVEWCLGDSTNLVGALFTRQAVWQVVVAGYYVCVDVVLVWQYAWYSYLKPNREVKIGRRSEFEGDQDGGPENPLWHGGDEIIEGISPVRSATNGQNFSKPDGQTDGDKKEHPSRSTPEPPIYSSSPPSKESSGASDVMIPTSQPRSSRNPSSIALPLSKTLMVTSMWCAAVSAHPTSSSTADITLSQSDSSIDTETVGRILSWSSTLLYLGSRLPQLYKNHIRRSTSGLSAKLFIAAFFGNLFYSCSLLTNPCAWNDYSPHGGGGWVGPDGSVRSDWVGRAAPFFLGAAGVLALDAAVGVQFLMFGERSTEVAVAIDEQGRWRRVTGWMRGWVPSSRTEELEQDAIEEREGLVLSDGNDRSHTYGTM
ncbi:MAG: hypothetical protein M1837_007081 [Sclerophora amabilis]|nr:MAG: hypothetical protein M1837_007081 [Sclerophora amabilis]